MLSDASAELWPVSGRPQTHKGMRHDSPSDVAETQPWQEALWQNHIGKSTVAGAKWCGGKNTLAGSTLGETVCREHCGCRQPEFSGGDRSCWWELTCLGGHVHPSVAAFARSLLAGTHISYDGDPLRDLTLTAFLDKFVQRKAKVCACIAPCMVKYSC